MLKFVVIAAFLLVLACASNPNSFKDQKCKEPRVTHPTMILYRPKDEVCTEALTSITIYDTQGDILLFQRQTQKVATVYNENEGAYNTYTSLDGVVSPVGREFAMLGRNSPTRRTCLQQDFGAPVGVLHGEVTSTAALDNIQLIEYTDLAHRHLRAQQTLQLDLPGTNGAQRLSLTVWYAAEQGHGVFVFLTYVSGDSQPLDQCSDIINACTANSTKRSAGGNKTIVPLMDSIMSKLDKTVSRKTFERIEKAMQQQ